MLRTIPCAVLCVVMTSASYGSILAGPTVNPANNHVYYLLDMTSWTSSEAEAVSLGGHLATINDAAENAWVLNTFGPLVSRSLWIGFNDVAVEGTFEWTSGEAVTYTNWNTGEPNNGGSVVGNEDYTAILGMSSPYPGYWNDTINVSGNGIGEYGVVEIPEPGAVVMLMVCGMVLMARRG